ncbi:MAG: endolytic transglycosylase MltG [Oscillospiraceae bacterium]|jgi:UPF0755 protein|nr:endolytic transglycosylase MltG [Oscillospiraceae bacterium]
MDEQNRNGEKQPFQLDVSFDTMELSSDMASLMEAAPPRPKGEVYFANPPSRAQTPAAPSAASSAAKRKKKKRKQRRSNSVLILVLTLSLALTGAICYAGITGLRDIFALGKEAEDVSLHLQDDLTTDQVIDILDKNGLITQKYLCKLYSDFTVWMKYRNLKEKPAPPVYLGGEYVVSKDMGLEELLNAFKSQPKSTETASLLFPEGYTVKQVVEKIGRYRVTRSDVLENTLLSTNFDYPFLTVINPQGRYYRYEGYLFPDTYEFYVNENASSALRRFFDNFNAKWTEEYATRAKELGMTTDQVITLASIIQKEAASAEQMKDVSAVLHNRLNNSAAYPKLECDSTRDYVTNNIATQMDRASAQYYYSIYNTYECLGLPAGPICNPGLSAIEAALNPKRQSPYYYFQHDKNGKIYLSKTKTEHDKVTTKLVIEGLAQ